MKEQTDVIVVGGGSSGSLLAARLSELDNQRVVLLESGEARPLDQYEDRVLSNARQPGVVSDRNWKLPVRICGTEQSSSSAGGSVFTYEGGRLLGGSSAVNATLAMRGSPDDYDSWSLELGEQWSWSQILGVFRDIENDDVEDPDNLHGTDGPIPIRRDKPDDLRPLQAAHYESCVRAGHQESPDHNHPKCAGVGFVPRNVIANKRISTRRAYLDSRSKPGNLSILTGAHATKLRWKSPQSIAGVEFIRDGVEHYIEAGKIILCLGALQTPGILVRSGVGEPDQLGSLGIRTRLSLKGVGRGLKDHPVVGIWGIPTPKHCDAGEVLRQVMLRYSSGETDRANDMNLCFMAGQRGASLNPRLAQGGKDPTIAGLTCTLNRSFSEGTVRSVSADPLAQPVVHLNCLGDDRDIAPVVDGVLRAWDTLQDPVLASAFERYFAWSPALFRSRSAMRNAVRTFVRPAAHLCRSARMGRDADPFAVVDSNCRVHGLDNVWIGDASVLPEIPTAPPHLTVLMVAEVLARHLGAPSK